MAMRTYGVETRGMAIELSDMQVLLTLNKESVYKVLGKDYFNDIDNIDFDEIIDFIDNISYAYFVGEFEGELLDYDRTTELEHYNGEDIIIIELQKDTLYDKYNNKDEVIEELKDNLKKVGIIVDDDFIKNHFGIINGTYWS